jgi:hypothetical protein
MDIENKNNGFQRKEYSKIKNWIKRQGIRKSLPI